MIGNSRGIVNAYVSVVEDHISHKPSPLHCTSTNNKPCRLIVKHMHRVMIHFGVLCHHPLVKGHIKPGGKNIWKDAETTGWLLVLGGARLHLNFYFRKHDCAHKELLWQGKRNGWRNVKEEIMMRETRAVVSCGRLCGYHGGISHQRTQSLGHKITATSDKHTKMTQGPDQSAISAISHEECSEKWEFNAILFIDYSSGIILIIKYN